ncbi:hypothetical protein [Pseudomonas sp.]|uniref:hypothetical protein n=1 Tax=unclassified Pseudomonas TaxID=196821 RepID=UPI0028B0567A|nr:hypothetical protein [Pseudomonas sp.]
MAWWICILLPRLFGCAAGWLSKAAINQRGDARDQQLLAGSGRLRWVKKGATPMENYSANQDFIFYI